MVSCILIAVGVGAAAAIAAVAVARIVLCAVGFTPCGISGGSTASRMMSYEAVSNGGGVSGGGVVATLQSVGAAGIPIIAVLVIGAIGAIVGGVIGGKFICNAGDAGNATISVAGEGMLGVAVSTAVSLIANFTV